MEIGKVVDLCGVVPGGAGWEAARAAVTASMVAHGCVVVAHDALSMDLQQALFSRTLPELFALPLEVKQKTVTSRLYRGYMGQLPKAITWESLRVEEPTNAASVRGFAEILWPEGNPKFCETIMSFAENMLKLEEMVETLVLEGLGARGESICAHFDLLHHAARMSYYGVPQDMQHNVTLPPHSDWIMMTGIVQHEVEGLEVHIEDGRWVTIPAAAGTFIFIAGEQLTHLTNGRVPTCLHRVRSLSNRDRFSMLFLRQQKDGVTVRVLEDLVDVEHPLVYKPLCHEEYYKWRNSEGHKFDDPLKEFCGVDKDVGAMV